MIDKILAQISCVVNCVECFGASASQCTKCAQGYLLVNFACVTTCNTAFPNPDYNDGICKNTIYSTDNPCDYGTYNSQPGAQDSTSCSPCDSGYFCPNRAATSTTGMCAPGFYCNSHSAFYQPNADLVNFVDTSFYQASYGGYCSPGKYCPQGASQPVSCDAGFYCPSYLMNELNNLLTCTAGFYCAGGAQTSTPTDGITGNICPAGSYCPTGSVSPMKCPPGTFLSYTGASDPSQCEVCLPGQYCGTSGLSAPTESCSAGYYCPAGTSVSTPIESICPMGYTCPTGSKTPQLCPNGQYTSGTGQTTCVSCPVGMYCTDSMATFGILCDQGSYCPGANLKIECPIGTYNPLTGQTSVAACVPCDAGYSCEQPGLKAETTKCATGFICTGGAITPQPGFTTEGGRMCVDGEICVQGSSTAISCTAGKYCKDYASGVTTSDCEAGYYCPVGQIQKNPLTYMCPPGSYCPQGSIQPTGCPISTYSPSMGASAVSDCQPCPAGNVCDTTGLQGSSLTNCAAGYYCPGGVSQNMPISYLCDAGYKCPQGSTYQQICLPGTNQPLRGQTSCNICPSGYYCDGTQPATNVSCPMGYYCPSGTQFGYQYPCPPGTYNNQLNATSVTNCLSIPRGFYSADEGVTQFVNPISEGTYSLSNGLTKPQQTACPQYFYCPLGTVDPKPCPDGTLSLGSGSISINDCVPCPRGYFCKFGTYFASNTYSPSNIAQAPLTPTVYGTCNSGHICMGGSSTATPTDNVVGYSCPQGYYCPLPATLYEIPCPAGSYNNLQGQTSCINCPAGSICNELGMQTPGACLPGHYCPGGNIRGIPCPPGTYNSITSATSVSDCNACPAGSFCDVWGLTQPAGLCDPGFICLVGSTVPTPFQFIYAPGMTGIGGRCPKGYFCPKGALAPQLCGNGTYNPNPGQASCLICPKGQYCSGLGLTNPSGLCQATYFCDEGSTNSTSYKCDPVNDGYCPQGTVIYTQCPDGQYLASDGTCQLCPAGQTCTNGHITPCQATKFCSNPAMYPYGELCPNGTYSNTPGLQNSTACKACPTKEFCLAGKIMGSCYAGYICDFGGDSPIPYNRTGSFACPMGFYCPAGASSPSICPLGMFTFYSGAIQQDECDFCQAGFYCGYGSISPVTCPQGNYCPLGSQEPTNCSVTHYNPDTGGTDYTACGPCKGGYYCSDQALGNLFAYNSTYKCPLGNYCPPGTWAPYPCKAGTYADTSLTYPPSALTQCPKCPRGYYCPEQTPDQHEYSCPNGTYCPAGSPWPILCPPGQYCKQFYNSSTGFNDISVQPCPEGYYCPLGSSTPVQCKQGELCKSGSGFPSRTLESSSICKPGQYFGFGQCNPCMPGFVCQNNTNTKYPVYLSTEGGFECPEGYYCPAGSSKMTPCPAGTFRSSIRGESLDDCQECNGDSYNTLTAQTQCVMCGRGSVGDPSTKYATCLCLGKFRQWRESDNQCICQSGYTEPALPTVSGTTSTDSQDCVPTVETPCTSGFHYDASTQSCVSDSVCKDPTLCNGQGDTEGYYSANALQCLCKNAANTTAAYCDATCQSSALKAFQVSSGQICLQAGTDQQCYNQSDFGSSLQLSNSKCMKGKCLIQNMINANGKMQGSYEAQDIFIKKWLVSHPNYKSPYSASGNSTARFLQASNQYINSAIICTILSNPVSFSVSTDHFPVYMKDSQYNTNPSFDAGVFDLLGTKLLQSNMSISTFVYTFSQEGVYVFGDYKNPLTSVTIIRVSQALCSSSLTLPGTIFPMTESNLKLFQITPQPLQLQSLPESLIAIPVIFISLTFLSTLLQYLWETKIEKDAYELRMKRAGRKKHFENEDGKLNKKQYLGDLYKLIKDNMDEVTKLINSHGNKANILKMLKDKTSLINELGEGGKQTVDELKNQLRELLEQLRFPDGSTLKELLASKELQKKLQQALNKQGSQVESEGEDDELDIDELDRRTDSAGGTSDEESEMFTDAVSRGLADMEAPDSDDEALARAKKVKDPHQREIEMERQLRIKRVQDRRKNDFKDKICDLVDDEANRDKLIDGFDEKMRSLDNMLKNENNRQENSLADKLADRKNRRKQAMGDVQATTGVKEERIERLEEEKRMLQDDLEEILENGMKDPNLIKLAEKEKEVELDKIERQILEKQDLVRQEYMNRLKNAKTDKEKERIVDEMQRRLAAVEDELRKEKSEQERNLEKALLLRQQKRIKKLAKDREQEIQKRDDEIQNLQGDIDKERVRVYIESGGDVMDVLDDATKDKVSRLVDKSVFAKGGGAKLELEKSELEQLDILKTQQKMEREHAMNAVEKEIEDGHDQDKIKLEEKLKNKMQQQRDQMTQQIGQATNDKDRKKLIADSKLMEQRLEDEMNNERLRQERLLEEKKASRRNQRKVKEMEIEQKQMGELAKKETELLQRKYDKLMVSHADSFDKEMGTALHALEKRGNADKAILLVNQTSNDLLEKKLRLLINKQFFELEKYLGTLYNQTALESMAAKEQARSRFKQAEEDAYANQTGEALVQRLAQLRELEQVEYDGIEHRMKEKEKQEACAIRERLAGKHFDEKRALQEDDQKQREQLIKGIVSRNDKGDASSAELQAMAQKLLACNKDRDGQELERMEKQKEEDLERIKLQIVAENEAQVQQLQKAIEEQMVKEKEMVEQRMKVKRDEVMGQKKRALEDRIKEMSGQLSQFQKDQIMKQFMIELNNLEKAIAMERDSQLSKMRARIIKKKIEIERLKKVDMEDKRVLQIKKQLGVYLLNQIQQARQKAEAAKNAGKSSAQPTTIKKDNGLVIKQKSIKGNEGNTQMIAGKDSLRLLLQQWSERVHNQNAVQDDQQQIWEKQTVDLNKNDSPRSSVSKMSKVTGLQGIRGLQRQGSLNSYTMEELLRRIRRVEKLTERMSNGRFDDPTRPPKDSVFRAINSIIDTASVSQSDMKLNRRQHSQNNY